VPRHRRARLSVVPRHRRARLTVVPRHRRARLTVVPRHRRARLSVVPRRITAGTGGLHQRSREPGPGGPSHGRRFVVRCYVCLAQALRGSPGAGAYLVCGGNLRPIVTRGLPESLGSDLVQWLQVQGDLSARERARTEITAGISSGDAGGGSGDAGRPAPAAALAAGRRGARDDVNGRQSRTSPVPCRRSTPAA